MPKALEVNDNDNNNNTTNNKKLIIRGYFKYDIRKFFFVQFELLMCGIYYRLVCFSIALFKHFSSIYTYICTAGDT